MYTVSRKAVKSMSCVIELHVLKWNLHSETTLYQ